MSKNRLIWFDRRDHVWRGIDRTFSLFAQEESPEQVRRTLDDLYIGYIRDVLDHTQNFDEMRSEMIPRRMPWIEWWKIRAYGLWCRLMLGVSRGEA